MAKHYRAWLTFAITLVHELAHACHFWLTGGFIELEPLWDRCEKHPEIGFSSETYIVGRVVDVSPFERMCKGKFRILRSVQLEDIHRMEDVEQARREMREENDSLSTQLWPTNEVPLLEMSQFRGSDFSSLTILISIPTPWPLSAQFPLPAHMNWFRYEEWSRKRNEWVVAGCYLFPPLGNLYDCVCKGRSSC